MEIIWKIKNVFGNDAIGITQIKEWNNYVNDGSTSVESKPCFHEAFNKTKNNEVIDQEWTIVMQKC